MLPKLATKWSEIELYSPHTPPPHSPMVLSKIFDRSFERIVTRNFQEKTKSAIPRAQNYAAWLLKNRETIFRKLTWKIPLSVTGKHPSIHLDSSFSFSHFHILSSCLGCYFSGICRTFHFGQMFNGLLSDTFDFYWSLILQFSSTTVRLWEGNFLFAVADN